MRANNALLTFPAAWPSYGKVASPRKFIGFTRKFDGIIRSLVGCSLIAKVSRAYMDKFEETTIPHMGTLFKMAYHLAGNRDDAEDLVQEVYLKARKAFHTLKDHNKCKSWLCSILYRHFIDETRKRRNFVELDNVADPNANFYTEWPSRFTSEDISKALEKLEPKQRTLLVAHFISGLKYQEIATSMNIPIGTVMSRIHRAKNFMRKELTRISRHPALKVLRGGRHGL